MAVDAIKYGPFCAVFITLVLFGHPAVGQEEGDDILVISKRMVALQQAGHYVEALPLAQRALELSEKAMGLDHPTVAVYIDHLAVLL
ncbi:MAG: hypothetical protein C4293_04770, partial [Nitrospiraceae bacterium]